MTVESAQVYRGVLPATRAGQRQPRQPGRDRGADRRVEPQARARRPAGHSRWQRSSALPQSPCARPRRAWPQPLPVLRLARVPALACSDPSDTRACCVCVRRMRGVCPAQTAARAERVATSTASEAEPTAGQGPTPLIAPRKPANAPYTALARPVQRFCALPYPDFPPFPQNALAVFPRSSHGGFWEDCVCD